ncbi:MAG TPA: ABC transporter permease [Terriglobales bacterium]|nr:ABC transporter permease [Terriglobales bacterium]
METLLQDLRYALRMLFKSPAFTSIAVLTLALGIGANTAIFTLVNALLLKTLPVRSPQELVVVGDPTAANERANGTPQVEVVSYPLYKELRDHNSVFNGLCAAASDHHTEVDIGQGDDPSSKKIVLRMVSGNYFSVLGVEPAGGRLISESDDTAENANPVVVLGYSYWQRKFALSPSIIGKDVRLNGYPFTVIGVAPPGFDGDIVGEQMAMFVPLSMQPEIVRGRHWLTAVNASWLSIIGRLKPGIIAEKAQAEMNVILQQALHGPYGAKLNSDDVKYLGKKKITVAPGENGISELRGDYSTPLFLMMGIVGLVLLIACVNVANLLLARASVRSKEIAVRLAIGASQGRLLRQLLTESILLASLGGIAGSLLAVWGVRLLVRIFDSQTSLPLSPDERVLGFAIAVSLLTGILFGLVPALRSLGVQVSPTLKDATVAAPSRSRFGWGKSLVAAQVALSLLVLFAAGLLVRSLQKLLAQDFGYRREHLVIARLDPMAAGYDNNKMKLLAQQLTARLQSTPQVQAASYSKNGLFAHSETGDAIIVPGFTGSERDRVALEDYVGPDYFGAVGIPILAGRGIEAQDTQTSTRVAVVNEALVKHFFRGQNPIGRQFLIDDPDWVNKPLTIVGISRDAKDHGSGLREAVRPRFYQAYQQTLDPNQIALLVQARGTPTSVVTTVQQVIKAIDPQLPIDIANTLDNLVTESAGDQIALAKLSAFFAGLALLLACVGLYGIISYTVAGRTREIGVRMALGAQRSDVLQMVLREGMLLVGVGVAIGIPLSLTSSRVLHSYLFGLRSTDPLSLAAVIAVLGVVAALAGFIPARRATKVNPVVALRYE